jgi:hypothetical protein
MLELERVVTIIFTKAQARTRDVSTAINYKGTLHPTFTRASLNVAAVVALFDTLPAPSTNEVDKVYRQLKDILSVTAEQQAESSLQRWVEVSSSSPGPSKASRQRTTMELPTAGTASSLTQVLTHLRPGHLSRCLDPLAHRQAHRGNRGAHRGPQWSSPQRGPHLH